MTALSDAVRTLLPAQMPKEHIKIRQTADGFQATWGSPVAVRVLISNAFFEQQLGRSERAMHLELATRFVQAVHDHVTKLPPAGEPAPGEYHIATPTTLLLNANLSPPPNATTYRIAEPEMAESDPPGYDPHTALGQSAAAVDQQITDDANGVRQEEKHHAFGPHYAADPGVVYEQLQQPPFKADTSIGWVARHTATFPEFPAHNGGTLGGLYEIERDTLKSWASKQDGKSGRGEIIRTLLAQEEITADLHEKLRVAGVELDTVAEEIETLLEGKTPAVEMAKRLKKCVDRLETAATEARK